jgi:hypothetical protein
MAMAARHLDVYYTTITNQPAAFQSEGKEFLRETAEKCRGDGGGLPGDDADAGGIASCSCGG